MCTCLVISMAGRVLAAMLLQISCCEASKKGHSLHLIPLMACMPCAHTLSCYLNDLITAHQVCSKNRADQDHGLMGQICVKIRLVVP
jgi:hypothetical protein